MSEPLSEQSADAFKGRIAALEAQLARSRQEIIDLTKRVLEMESSHKGGSARVSQTARAEPAGRGLHRDDRIAIFKAMEMSLHLTRVPLIMRTKFMRRRHQRRLARALVGLKLLDVEWYCNTYPEALESGEDPALYFVKTGGRKGHASRAKFLIEERPR